MVIFFAGLLKAPDFRRLSPIGAPVCGSALRRKGNWLGAALKSSLVLCTIAWALALPCAAQAQVSVWLQSPLPGSNPSKIQVTAVPYSSSAITNWVIYVDDAVAYQTNNTPGTLSKTLTLAKGSHLLYARAWTTDSDGTSVTLLLQVGPPAYSSTVLPTPPRGAKVYTQMQNSTANWTECSLCAEGTNDTTNFWMAPFQHSPSKSGSSLQVYVDGLPWTNALFIDTMGGTSSATHFLWDSWVYLDSTTAASVWSSEFDLWQTLGGKEFMIGSQCDFGDGYWDTWDSANNRWIENGIPCPRWAANTWHHVQWYVERISSTQYRYDTLVVDGHGYGFNQIYKANPIAWPDAVGIQYQLDQGPSGAPAQEWIDNVKLTTW